MDEVDSAVEANTSLTSVESENDIEGLGAMQTSHLESSSFTVEKDKKGKPTPAQLFFHDLSRDCASTAKIWKRAPMLTEISSTKKHSFLRSVVEAAPQLKYKQKEIWQRLGTALQNHHKYIADKDNGKRKTPVKTKPTHFEIGDHVDLLTRDKNQTVVEGVVIKIEEVYSDVVLQDFQPAALHKDQGPVVQSIVSLTSSLRVISLTVLVDSIYNFLTFFTEKM